MESIWNKFIITEEQRLKMESGDREAIERFYFENYDYLTNLARSYARGKYLVGDHRYNAEDMMQDLYLSIFDKDKFVFISASHFHTKLKCQFYSSGFTGAWERRRNNQKKKYELQKVMYIVDRPQYEGERSEERKLIDRYVHTPEPYVEIMRIAEKRRQERLEEDLPIFLATFLTEKQLEMWNEKKFHVSIEIKLRKNADKVISFLRAHGTPEYRLAGEVLPFFKQGSAEHKARTAARAEEKRVQREWKLEHFSELTDSQRQQIRKAKWYKEMMREAGSAL